jgi:CRP-like cAMP-binding protein
MIASEYFALLRNLLVAASHHTASERIAQVLANHSREVGRKGFEGTVIPISNEDLANEANVTIFTVSRTLSEWQRKGLVVKRRGEVVVRSPKELVRMET